MYNCCTVQDQEKHGILNAKIQNFATHGKRVQKIIRNTRDANIRRKTHIRVFFVSTECLTPKSGLRSDFSLKYVFENVSIPLVRANLRFDKEMKPKKWSPPLKAHRYISAELNENCYSQDYRIYSEKDA